MINLNIVPLLTVFLTTWQGFHLALACRSSNQCIGLNKMCKDNACGCREGYTENAEGTCIDKKCNIPGCMTCLNEFSCKRCVKYILFEKRRCVDHCSSKPYVILNGTYEGQVCKESIEKDNQSFYMTLVAVFSVLIVIVLVAISCFLFIRRRKSFALTNENDECYQMGNLRHKPSIRQILGKYNEPKYMEQEAGSPSEEDFERLVRSLKEDAQFFLSMINEVKRKLNMLNDQNTDQAKQYKALIRDLSRVLRILNTKVSKLEMPSDGVPLLLWAENALKRFEYAELKNPIRDQTTDSLGEYSGAHMDTKDAIL